MKYKHRDIKIFKTDIPFLETKDILTISNKIYTEVYNYEHFKKIKNEVINKPKNIFQEYNTETYKIYKEISKLLKDACQYYSIDQIYDPILNNFVYYNQSTILIIFLVDFFYLL